MLMTNFLGENLFDDFFSDFIRPERRALNCSTSASSLMRTDVKDTEDGYELHVELPGYKKENVSAELKDGTLLITASTKSENEEKDEKGKFIRRERFSGNCSRSFYVGDAVEQEDIKAKFEDGILKILVPKKENKPELEKRKFIAIEG
ncbi:MAG: Hsp20/alpha crystallin family protein [Anaerovoracaceae bacterium]|nr:Hsp20/alpha crystallin family protein [Anaerovoracaceae bacterium]